MSKKEHFKAAYSLKSGEETKQHYKSWAQTYDEEVGVQNKYAQPARVAEMLARVQPNRDIAILDAGCGSGLSGAALHQQDYTNLIGCDFSQEMLAQAAKKNIYQDLFTADLNAGLLTISDEQFDAITCVGVFSFGHVDPSACRELLRCLKPSGHLIIALNEEFWNRGALKDEIEHLASKGVVTELAREFGEHLPGHDVNGWVIALEKCK